MARPRIAHLVWLSLSALILGYAASIAVVVAIAHETNKSVQEHLSGTFPAAVAAREAATYWERLRRRYEEAVVYGDRDILISCAQLAQSTHASLADIGNLPEMSVELRDRVDQLRSLIESVDHEAQERYAPLVAKGVKQVDTITTQALALLHERFLALQARLDRLADDLREQHLGGMQAMAERLLRSRTLAVAGFIIAMSISLITLTVTLRKAILGPLAELLGLIGQMEGRNTPVVITRNEVDVVTSRFIDMSETIRATISQLRVQVEERQQTEADYRTTIESIDDGILVIDRYGRVMRANLGSSRFTGRTPEECIGQSASKLLRRTDHEDSEVATTSFHHRRERVSLSDRDGIAREVDILRSPLRHKGDNPEGAVLILHDVTDQVAMEAQLRQSQKMESIGRLAGGIAHDFNNMLTGILGSADLLLREQPDEERHRLARIIVQSAERAAGLTRKLLAFSRRGALRKEPVDLHRIIRDSLELTGPSLPTGIRLVDSLQARLHTVIGDDSSLQNVILNLIVNAKDAIGTRGTITVRTSDLRLDVKQCAGHPDALKAGNYLRIEVADDGCGMPDAVRERAFEPFFTTKELGKGTGLGLAMVYGTVQEHHGSIAIRSGPGAGTCFTIDIPCGAAVDPAEAKTLGQDARGLRVLVIDDEDLVRDTITALLENLGASVDMAANGSEGIELFRSKRPPFDLCLVDLTMPGLDGADVCAQLRSLDPDVPLVIASGMVDEATESDLRRSGVTALLRKPFASADLARLIDQIRYVRR